MSESNGAFKGRSKCRNVTAAHPCPVCAKPDWCSVSEDGDVYLCRRQGEPSQQRTDANGDTYYLHRLRPSPTATEPKYSLADGGGRVADPDTRHEIYYALLQCLKLFGQHEAALKARGLKDGLLAAGYRSLPERGRYKAVRRLIEAGFEEHLPTVPGFFVAEGEGKYWTVSGASGLFVPVRDFQDRIIALLIRSDDATEGGKYRWLSSKKRGGPGPGAPIHVPRFKGDRSTVRITEGALKADVATRLSGVLTIGLPGVNSGSRAPKILKELGAKVVRVAFDADASRNKIGGLSLYNLVHNLREKGFEVELETWDESKGKGIDDLLAAGHQPEVSQGERALLVAQGIAEQAGAFSQPGSAPPGGSGPDLRWLVRGIYRIGRDPAAEAGVNDPWMVTLPGRFGLIYLFGRDRLAVEISDPRIAARIATALDKAQPYQRGWWHWCYTFPVSRLGAIAAIIQPAKVRRMSNAAKKRLAAIGGSTRFGVPNTALDPSSERQDATSAAETTNEPSAAVGAVVALT
jgi:hypothetical protein